MVLKILIRGDKVTEIIDVTGLSCPEPVLRTLEKIKTVSRGELEVWVDTPTSVENVIRGIRSLGWEVVEVRKEEQIYKIKIKKD